jgi:hypothetical protein
MFGHGYEKDISKIPMSDNTVSRRIKDMSQDVQSQMITNIKEVDFMPPSWTSQLISLEK